MDILKKTLLVAFYIGIIAIGIIGFIALKSVRERSPPSDIPSQNVQDHIADSLTSEEVIE